MQSGSHMIVQQPYTTPADDRNDRKKTLDGDSHYHFVRAMYRGRVLCQDGLLCQDELAIRCYIAQSQNPKGITAVPHHKLGS